MVLKVREVFTPGQWGGGRREPSGPLAKFCISSSHDLEMCTPYCMDVRPQQADQLANCKEDRLKEGDWTQVGYIPLSCWYYGFVQTL